MIHYKHCKINIKLNPNYLHLAPQGQDWFSWRSGTVEATGDWTFCLQLCRAQLKLVITTSTNVDIRKLKSPNNRLMLPWQKQLLPSSGTRACFSMQGNRDCRVQLIGMLWTSRVCSRLKLCLSPGLPTISSNWQTGCITHLCFKLLASLVRQLHMLKNK